MKQLFILLILIFSCSAKVTPPPLHQTSFDHAIKQDLINRLDQPGYENDAIKSFTHFFVTHPEYIDQLSLLDLQDFITFVKYRWDSSYRAAPILLRINSYFKNDARYKIYEEKLHMLFEDWASHYELFKEAVEIKDIRKIEYFIQCGMPCDEIAEEVLRCADYDIEIVTILENAGADKQMIKNLRKYTNFYICIKENNIDYIKKGIELGYNLNEVPWYIDTTALMVATLGPTSDETVFECLLAHGANINEPCNGIGSTALHIAAGWSNHAMIKWLIEHGADINAQDKKGWTPLHYAYRGCRESNFIMLMSFNPDLTIRDYKGKTLLEYAYDFHNKYEYKKDSKQDLYISMMMHKIIVPAEACQAGRPG